MSERASHRVVRAALVLVLALPVLGACDSAKATVDCGKSAVRIAGDLQDVSDRATNVGNLVDPTRRRETSEAVDKLQRDSDDFSRGSDDPARARAARDLDKAADNVRDSLNHGRTPDLKPLADAVGEWTKACA